MTVSLEAPRLLGPIQHRQVRCLHVAAGPLDSDERMVEVGPRHGSHLRRARAFDGRIHVAIMRRGV